MSSFCIFDKTCFDYPFYAILKVPAEIRLYFRKWHNVSITNIFHIRLLSSFFSSLFFPSSFPFSLCKSYASCNASWGYRYIDDYNPDSNYSIGNFIFMFSSLPAQIKISVRLSSQTESAQNFI